VNKHELEHVRGSFYNSKEVRSYVRWEGRLGGFVRFNRNNWKIDLLG
jgi:hypothetical protein